MALVPPPRHQHRGAFIFVSKEYTICLAVAQVCCVCCIQYNSCSMFALELKQSAPVTVNSSNRTVSGKSPMSTVLYLCAVLYREVEQSFHNGHQT